MLEPPPALVRTLRDIHEDADGWLAALPETISRLEAAWNVRTTHLVPQLSYNLVAHAEGPDGLGYILKLSPPSEELAREGLALTHYAGDGACRLLARDDAVGALLLERLMPGVSLQETWTPEADERHTRVAAGLMRRLWRPAPHSEGFRTLESWARALTDDRETPIPASLRGRAHARLGELNTGDPVLLHADLHHGNILTSEDAHRAIDPKGVVGARGYDVGPLLLNPLHASTATFIGVLPRRLAVLSEVLEMSAAELAAWGFVHAVLSACWSAEDHGEGWEGALEVAAALDSLA